MRSAPPPSKSLRAGDHGPATCITTIENYDDRAKLADYSDDNARSDTPTPFLLQRHPGDLYFDNHVYDRASRTTPGAPSQSKICPAYNVMAVQRVITQPGKDYARA